MVFETTVLGYWLLGPSGDQSRSNSFTLGPNVGIVNLPQPQTSTAQGPSDFYMGVSPHRRFFRRKKDL